MKKNRHPEYRKVLFVDSSSGDRILIGSTYQTDQSEKYEVKEYPVCVVPITSATLR